MGPKPVTGVLIRRHVMMETEIASISQGTPRTPRGHQKLREGHGTDCPLEPPDRTNPADTLISDFKPQELSENTFLLFSATWFGGICYGGPRKLTQASPLLIQSS